MTQIKSRDLRPPTQKPPLGAQINWSHPLARGLVMCYLFNEGRGNRVYNLANLSSGNHGQTGVADVGAGESMSLAGGAVPIWYAGNFNGPTLVFSGTNYLQGGKPTFTPGTQYTVATWVLNNNYGITQIASAWRTNGEQNIWYQLDCYLNNARFLVGNPNYVAAQVAVTNSRGYQLVGTRNGSAIKIYANGVAGTPATMTDTTSGTNKLIVGDYDGLVTGWSGWIDHYLMWNRALSQSEVQWLYQEPFAFMLPLTGPRVVKAVAAGATARSFAVMVG